MSFCWRTRIEMEREQGESSKRSASWNLIERERQRYREERTNTRFDNRVFREDQAESAQKFKGFSVGGTFDDEEQWTKAVASIADDDDIQHYTINPHQGHSTSNQDVQLRARFLNDGSRVIRGIVKQASAETRGISADVRRASKSLEKSAMAGEPVAVHKESLKSSNDDVLESARAILGKSFKEKFVKREEGLSHGVEAKSESLADEKRIVVGEKRGVIRRWNPSRSLLKAMNIENSTAVAGKGKSFATEDGISEWNKIEQEMKKHAKRD
mmetsp:Transcript_619/g.1112  ORF Transcript_619/g.1112 Transcript_619/m.1112 type:complete len:270 (-) Transcript_619:765-1574(-)